ncbi:MAG: hypothetical protein HQM08_30660 [Candidatus Riflebacteria bacterium]|nr:hypothetical protein [Candidatus Riflebacteria bacterium]
MIDHLSLAGNPIPARNHPSIDGGFSSIVHPPPRVITKPRIAHPSRICQKKIRPTLLPFIRRGEPSSAASHDHPLPESLSPQPVTNRVCHPTSGRLVQQLIGRRIRDGQCPV